MERVLVAMSGGVDSSVAAYLLKEQGYETIGVSFHLWKNGSSCCSEEGVEYAKKVSDKLNIPHYTLNFQNVFEKKVIKNFCDEYKKGRTPNPCIRCNKYIKFDLFLNVAEKLNADFIATGHYARIEFKDGKYCLKKGVDLNKDQSYMLYIMNQKILKQTLLPLGNLKKEEVRKIAKKIKLPNADVEESQEICFVQDNNYKVFLENYLKEKINSGYIINKQREILGEHKGILFYTIGQRKGLGISSKKPLYVIEIDTKNNFIIVGEEEELYKETLFADEVNFVDDIPKDKVEVRAKVRYKAKEEIAILTLLEKNRVHLKFSKPVKAITPGQSVVFYKDDLVLGGGIIE